jgi:hypothetical protein
MRAVARSLGTSPWRPAALSPAKTATVLATPSATPGMVLEARCVFDGEGTWRQIFQEKIGG